MGLLSSGPVVTDVVQVRKTAHLVQSWWNQYRAPVYGLNLRISHAELLKCCEIGHSLFEGRFFSQPPGPFKRAAAFVVITRLNPFFDFLPVSAEAIEYVPTTLREKQEWTARIVTLTIPIVLRRTYAEINGERAQLTGWNGFPSLHYKLEFLAWVRWLDSFEQYRTVMPAREWYDFCERRLARMVMALSLMIEGCYYHRPTTAEEDDICGRTESCLANLENDMSLLTDCFYDVVMEEHSPGFD